MLRRPFSLLLEMRAVGHSANCTARVGKGEKSNGPVLAIALLT